MEACNLIHILNLGGLVELAPLNHMTLTGRPPLTSSGAEMSSSSETTYTAVDSSPRASSARLNENRPTFITLPERNTTLLPESLLPESLPTPVKPPSPPYLGRLTTTPSPAPSMHLETPLHALVVDDDSITRQLMTRLLNRLGVTVTCAENGAVALDLILGAGTDPPAMPGKPPAHCSNPSVSDLATPADQRFDIIFLDNQMV